jgi:hypothetical protein
MNSHVRPRTRCLLFVAVLALFASCATSPVASRQAEPARGPSQPWDSGYHPDPSGFNSKDLALLLNGLASH